MSVRDVSNLRKEGKLKEAYELARRELNEDPNIWTRTSLFWVLRDMVIHHFLPANNLEQARFCMNQMERLIPDMMDEDGVGEKAYQNLLKLMLPNANDVKSASELSKSEPNEAYYKLTNLFGKDASLLDPKLHEDFGWVVYRYMKLNRAQLDSIQTRSLLWDYMQLKNVRPSLLHSTILNFALSFSKDHQDFNFYKFFMLWGAENLRKEDYQEGWVDGHEITPLTYRICKTILDSNEDFNINDFVSKFKEQDIIVENLRQAYFWKLINLQKDNRYDYLFRSFTYYAENYSQFGASHWHSEILRLANRFMIDGNSDRFVTFFMLWDGSGNLRTEDWSKETNNEGKEYPSLAFKSAKKCFDLINATSKDLISKSTLLWLKALYGKVKQYESNDEWSVRSYATICVLCGEIEDAIATYKFLLLHTGDKYYLWAELANLLLDNIELGIGLLLKAKRLENNEDFLGDIHLTLASLWLKVGYISIAKKELETYFAHRKAKGWAVSNRFYKLDKESNNGENKTELVDFNEYIKKAEDYVYEAYPWTDFVVIDKWTSNGVEYLNLSDGNEICINVKTKKFPVLKKSKEGEIIQLRYCIMENNRPDSSLTLWRHSSVVVKKAIPLIVRKTDKEPWSILPVKYGVVSFVNESKNVLHIITQDSKQSFCKYNGKHIPVNSFVRFREYMDNRDGDNKTCIANLEACPRTEALCKMPTRVVVVDDVNNTKNLFHVILGPGKIGDIVRFDQTEIRPLVGDFLRITYCITKNKDGKKRIKFLDIQTTEEECEGVRNTITGRLELKYRERYAECYDDEELNDCEYGADFAFIKDFYVHRSLLQKYNINEDCDVIAKIVLAGGNKWKVYDLEFL